MLNFFHVYNIIILKGKGRIAMQKLYENIKKYRLERNLSQTELAKLIGYTDRSSIAKIEKGSVDLPQSKIKMFADVFGVSPSKLMGNENEDPILLYRDSVIEKIDDILNKKGFYLDYNTTDDFIFTIRRLTTKEEIASLEDGELISGYEKLIRKKNIINADDIISLKSNKKYTSSSFNSHSRSEGWIPVVGDVAAGLPIEAIEDILDYEQIDVKLLDSADYFGLRIKGNSMEPRIKEGDVVIVRVQPDVESGEVAIVKVNGDHATCKVLKKYADMLVLLPLNPTFEPQEYTKEDVKTLPVQVIGKVVELRGKF